MTVHAAIALVSPFPPPIPSSLVRLAFGNVAKVEHPEIVRPKRFTLV